MVKVDLIEMLTGGHFEEPPKLPLLFLLSATTEAAYDFVVPPCPCNYMVESISPCSNHIHCCQCDQLCPHVQHVFSVAMPTMYGPLW